MHRIVHAYIYMHARCHPTYYILYMLLHTTYNSYTRLLRTSMCACVCATTYLRACYSCAHMRICTYSII